jgi:glycosyltransferase involved in cell wall biosynthesis
MLGQITPLILTYNEAPNIGRTLEQLRWAKDIVVVDSFSEDETLDIVSGFPQARVFQRGFDSHDRQWNFGLKETGINSEWVMALDADFELTPRLVEEIVSLQSSPETKGYRAAFVFCINGRRLRSALCPPVTFLYRHAGAEYFRDGHTQRLRIDGDVESLKSPILHDDRKPLAHWLESQQRYAKLEAAKILDKAANLDLADRIRRLRVVAPIAMPLYFLLARGGILDGRVGFYYAFQRMVAELMLSLYLLEHDLPIKLREGIKTSSVIDAGPPELTDLREGQ